MKAVLAFAFIALLSYGALQISEHSWQRGYEAAQAEILKESVENAVKAAKTTTAEQKPLRDSINHNFATAPVPGAKPTPSSTPAVTGGATVAAASVQTTQQIEASFVDINQDNKIKYWCRSTSLTPPGDVGGICQYPSACFFCSSMQADVVPPESKDAHPVCNDGTFAQVESATCCPLGHTDSHWECPDLRTCFEDSNDKCARAPAGS